MIHFKDGKNKSSALTTRWAQMSKQEQIIERKKMEIQAKLEAQKQAAALAAQAKLINPSAKEDKGSNNIFSNDGSFMSQYKALIDKQKKEKEEKEQKEREEALEAEKKNIVEAQSEAQRSDGHGFNETQGNSNERKSRDRQRRWGDKGKNQSHSPTTPVVEDRKNNMIDHKNIPSLMQIPVMPPKPPSPNTDQWNNDDSNEPNDSDQSNNPSLPESGILPSGPMGMGPMGFGPMGPGMMGPGPMGPGQMGPGLMGPGPGPMGPGSGPMGPGPMGGRFMGPGGNGPLSNNGPNMGPGPMMGRGGPMPPFMGGPPNFPMPPNFMGPNGPNGPGGPCGPGPMPPNMCGPNMRGPGPNGPMPPFFPPFPNPQMMRPNGPPNSMLPPNSMNDNNNQNNNMPFMGPRPPFGPNGPNFGPGGPNGNGPPNMPFMPPNSMSAPMPPGSMPGNSLQRIPEPKPLDAGNIPPPEPMKLQNIPSPVPLQLNHIPKPKEMDPGNIPPPNPSQVFSADRMPPPVQRAAVEVATNGDQWENVLKAIHSQDQNMWFLHNPNSNEYRSFRDLVNKIRNEGTFKPEIKPEDKYEPEFCLEDDDSNDSRLFKHEKNSGYQDSKYNLYMGNVKTEHTSSQSDDDSEVKRERRKRKKSRWGDDPPMADIKPPGVLALPPNIPGVKLSKVDESGLRLTNLNKNNPALMQYAMTNYGTTNLSPEDWAKCEDNFKLNLLYQDMLKKREEVERLNAAGKNKYEYDSDEDTSEGTWEHRIRAKEMCATEKWANELTKQAAGKHHIGDFLPPEELRKFMEKYSAARGGQEPDLSDYKEYKLKEDNVGFKMLQKLGWNEGQGLGAEGTGIVDPINKSNQPVANLGLGAASSDVVSADDDEFDAYRKRMMLAYRFRPNPLNNPRRPYY